MTENQLAKELLEVIPPLEHLIRRQRNKKDMRQTFLTLPAKQREPVLRSLEILKQAILPK